MLQKAAAGQGRTFHHGYECYRLICRPAPSAATAGARINLASSSCAFWQGQLCKLHVACLASPSSLSLSSSSTSCHQHPLVLVFLGLLATLACSTSIRLGIFRRRSANSPAGPKALRWITRKCQAICRPRHLALASTLLTATSVFAH